MANIRVGYTENGYTYMGGDPRNQRSWASNMDDAAPSAFGAPGVDKPGLPDSRTLPTPKNFPGFGNPAAEYARRQEPVNRMLDGAARMTRPGADAKFGGASDIMLGAGEIALPLAAVPLAGASSVGAAAGLLGRMAVGAGGGYLGGQAARGLVPKDKPGLQDFAENMGAYSLPTSKGELAAQVAAVLPVGKVAQAAMKIPAVAKFAGAVAAAMPNFRSARQQVAGGLLADMAPSPKPMKTNYGRTTVENPVRKAYPGIYQNPRTLVDEATSRVAPESPLLKQLFGVNRDDLWQMSQQGTRQGNLTDAPFPKSRGSKVAQQLTGPANTRRVQDIIGEASTKPELYRPMASWYTMDPLYQKFVDEFGPELAPAKYAHYNTMTGMASPGSDVLTELNRGTAAHWLANEGRWGDFMKYGGKANRGPADMANISGHPYHLTAHTPPMDKYLKAGKVDMGSAKVPTYIQASGVPETGFQTDWPVGDAHWSRAVGLADVRTAKNFAASATVPEMSTLSPWFRDKIAAKVGLKAVPAQAVLWGAGSGATGVDSPIGAGKLELTAMKIGQTASRLGITPETLLQRIIRGKGHAAIAGGLVGGGLLATDEQQ